MTTIKLRAKNDRNGNPRRCYLTLDTGTPIAVYDEGYDGDDAITNPDHFAAYTGHIIDVSVAEYRSHLARFSPNHAG